MCFSYSYVFQLFKVSSRRAIDFGTRPRPPSPRPAGAAETAEDREGSRLRSVHARGNSPDSATARASGRLW